MTKKAFSLVELIVVMTLIVILSTIGYFSYLDYTEESKDSNRVTQVHTIGDGIDLYLSKGVKIEPDTSIDIFFDGDKYSSQGIVGDRVIGQIKYLSDGVDPKDKTPFVFALANNKRDYDMMALLENEINMPKKILSGNFTKIGDRTPYVYGKNSVGIMIDQFGVPVNKSLSGSLNLNCNDSNNYSIIFENGRVLSPVTWQSEFETGPCYIEPAPGCKTTPGYTNASFNVGTPTKPNQEWIKADNSESCSYQCINGYTGIFCEVAPGVAIAGGGSTSGGALLPGETSSSSSSGGSTSSTSSSTSSGGPSQSELDLFEDIIVNKCGVAQLTFDTNFNAANGHYNGTIDCHHRNLTDEDLNKFTPLRSLSGDLILGHAGISPNRNIFTHANGLLNLRSLNTLSLRSTSIIDISGISGITNIDRLILGGNNITNLAPIYNFITLTYLDIEFNGGNYKGTLSDISPLQNLVNLRTINAMANPISDISMLTNLVNLERFDFRRTDITEISSISGATGLRSLFIGETTISDISPILNFPNLLSIYLFGCTNLTDISYLNSLTNLSNIDITSSGVNDFSQLNSFSTTNPNFRMNVNNSEYMLKMDSSSPICTNYYTGGTPINTYQIVFNDGTYSPNTGSKKHFICNP